MTVIYLSMPVNQMLYLALKIKAPKRIHYVRPIIFTSSRIQNHRNPFKIQHHFVHPVHWVLRIPQKQAVKRLCTVVQSHWKNHLLHRYPETSLTKVASSVTEAFPQIHAAAAAEDTTMAVICWVTWKNHVKQWPMIVQPNTNHQQRQSQRLVKALNRAKHISLKVYHKQKFK